MKLIPALRSYGQVRFHWTVAKLGYGFSRLRQTQADGFGIVNEISRDTRLVQTPTETVQLFEAARATRALPGEIAEVGSFKGATARIITEALPAKTLHVCDTFEGLPHGNEDCFEAGDFSSCLADVRSYLQGRNVAFHKGLFPQDTGKELAAMQFSFVHLDVDLYRSTLESLQFFWPRMTMGGILISHDYPLVEGVVRAFAEFFQGRPDPVMSLTGNQVIAVKAAA